MRSYCFRINWIKTYILDYFWRDGIRSILVVSTVLTSYHFHLLTTGTTSVVRSARTLLLVPTICSQLCTWYTGTMIATELSDCMDRFHEIHYIEWETIWRIFMVRWETDEETNDLKTRQCVAGFVEAHVWCIETPRKAEKVPSRNPNSMMPEDYVTCSFVNLKTRNSSLSWKMGVKS